MSKGSKRINVRKVDWYYLSLFLLWRHLFDSHVQWSPVCLPDDMTGLWCACDVAIVADKYCAGFKSYIWKSFGFLPYWKEKSAASRKKKETTPTHWPEMFLKCCYVNIPDYSSKCQFSLAQNIIHWLSPGINELPFPWPFPDLWLAWLKHNGTTWSDWFESETTQCKKHWWLKHFHGAIFQAISSQIFEVYIDPKK